MTSDRVAFSRPDPPWNNQHSDSSSDSARARRHVPLLPSAHSDAPLGGSEHGGVSQDTDSYLCPSYLCAATPLEFA